MKSFESYEVKMKMRNKWVSKTISHKDLTEIIEWYEGNAKLFEHWVHYLNYFIGDNINQYLIPKLCEYEKEENNIDIYLISFDFSSFMDEGVRKHPTLTMYFPDNHKCLKIVKKDYLEAFGEAKFKTFNWESESEDCMIYNKDKTLMEEFLSWSYNKYMVPKINEIVKFFGIKNISNKTVYFITEK